MEAAPRAHILIISGGVNYGENAEVEDPLVLGRGPRAALRPRGRCRRQALRSAAEMVAGEPTHWHQGGQRATAIDKVWIGAPRWLLAQT